MDVDFWKLTDFAVSGYSVLRFCIPSASGIMLCSVREIQAKGMKNILKKIYRYLEFCIHTVLFFPKILTYITVLAKFF